MIKTLISYREHCLAAARVWFCCIFPSVAIPSFSSAAVTGREYKGTTFYGTELPIEDMSQINVYSFEDNGFAIPSRTGT